MNEVLRQSDPMVSVVVPCHRTGSRIAQLVSEVQQELASVTGSWELVLVDDASPDDITWHAISTAAEQDGRVRGIQLMAQSGQFAATLSGLGASRGEVVITMDDDLSHRPDQIHHLLDALRTSTDLDAVVATYSQTNRKPYRRMGSRIYRRLLKHTFGLPSTLSLTGFRALRRPVVDALLAHETRKPQFGALLLQTTKRIRNVEVSAQVGREAKSRYRLRSLIGYSLLNLIEAGIHPMRLITVAGLTAATTSILVSAYYTLRWVVGGVEVAGFTSTMLLINFFGGLTMASIGVLAEYVGRILEEVRGAPVFVERQRTDHPGPP